MASCAIKLGNWRLLPAPLLVGITVVFISGMLVGWAEPPAKTGEYKVKAGLLYNFAKYGEWPANAFESSTNALVIGVLGNDPFREVLDAIVAGKTIDQRTVRTLRFQRVEDVAGCQILFISDAAKEQWPAIRARLRGHSILTVSDLEEFAERGGQIQFIMEGNQVQFDVNLTAVRQAGLKLDANLLRVARRVIRPVHEREAD